MKKKHKEQDENVKKVVIETEAAEKEVEEQESIEQLAEDFAALQTELEKLRKDAEESHDKYLRTLADFDNYRRRQREETARQVGLGKEGIVLQLLPIIDNFNRALESSKAGQDYDSLVEGVSLTLRQIIDMLAKEGVEPIEAVGQEFNPELHEAMMRVETEEYPENTIIEEFEKGYTINGKVVRPSKVTVAAG